LIVSKIFCEAFPFRKDLVIVNETIRDINKKVIGARSLSFNPYFPDHEQD